MDLFRNITFFKVEKYSPFLSDHCPLFYEIHSLSPPTEEGNEDLREAPNSLYLNTQDKQKLKESLKSPEIADRLKLMTMNYKGDPQTMMSEVSKTLLDACSKANIKPKNKSCKIGNDEPWFDTECRKLKNSIKRKCKTLRKNSSKKNLNSEILAQNKLLKNMIKKKKEEYKLKVVNEMNLKKGDQKTFWKLLRKLKNPKTEKLFQNAISGKKWENHFKRVLIDNSHEPKYPPDSQNIGPLDGIITMDELSKASYVLRPNKSSGSDLISNEMLLCLIEVQPEILIKLLNRIFDTNAKIKQFSHSMIAPIFKSGVKTEPNNYRGISLLSCLGKLYAAILNQRLIHYVLEKTILKAEQLGFLPGNRTSDAHIILNTLIQFYCHKNNKKIFACFVDFQKAFDTIPRDLLFNKLLAHGITGKFFNTLKTLYTNDNCCVKIGGKITDDFQANQGVRQGCILSPLLFNIFLSDIVEHFAGEECTPLKFENTNIIGCLVWADDLIALSESENGLQNMLQNLSIYAQENRMKINSTKTKCIIFNKTGKFLRRSFKVGDQTIYTTNNYKYLGFIVTPSGEITTGLKDLKDRALRAYYSLKGNMGRYFMLCPETTLHLFDTLIKPILLYNSDFWGCLKMPGNNPIENLHMRFCKDLLGVQRQTTNIGVLLELGKIPLMLYGVKNCLKNWSRIHISRKANNLVLLACQTSLNHSLKWTEQIKRCLDMSGIGSENKNPFIFNIVFKRLMDIFYQEAFININREDSKLRTFGKLKTNIGMTKYLTQTRYIDSRTALSRLRLSNHDLMIEKGRHSKIEKNRRYCPFCPNHVETELHFLLQCNKFRSMRTVLITEIENAIPSFHLSSDEDKFKILLNNENIANQVGKYIDKTLDCRRFLLRKHKNCT